MTESINQFAVVQRSGFAPENAGVSAVGLVRIAGGAFNRFEHATVWRASRAQEILSFLPLYSEKV